MVCHNTLCSCSVHIVCYNMLCSCIVNGLSQYAMFMLAMEWWGHNKLCSCIVQWCVTIYYVHV